MERKLQSAAVPRSRLARLSKLGGLAGRVAGNMLVGSKELIAGRKPVARDLLLTTKNLGHLADKLATMRGAAMKLGQLLSMDAGNLIPQELAVVLERLRSEAMSMPAMQLMDVLESNWGDEWQDQFQYFSFDPIAAASIGQVHRARTQDNELAIKIQYPGVKQSIDSDLDNVVSLIRMSGLIPKELDLTPLIDEARTQLKQEADYLKEGCYIREYAAKLAHFSRRDEVMLPAYIETLSSADILAMSFMEGEPLERLASVSVAERDRVVSLLFELFFTEFFHNHCVQTDPNLANYLFNPDSGKLILLDFGATRQFSETFVSHYSAVMRAAVAEDKQGLLSALQTLGFLDAEGERNNLDVVLKIFIMATEPMRQKGIYDFATSDIAQRIHQKGMSVSSDPEAWHTPPPDVLFLHRKMAGLYLIAQRFGAKVDVSSMFKHYL